MRPGGVKAIWDGRGGAMAGTTPPHREATPMTESPAAPDQSLAAIAGLLAKLDICMLTSRAGDGALHGRPMSNNGDVEYDGDSWFFAPADGRMVHEIEAEPQVELAFIDSANATWINLEGEATVVHDDHERKRALWQKDLERWFPNGPDDPGVVLIKVRARHIDAWSKEGDISLDR
jgi:general stress protein 26